MRDKKDKSAKAKRGAKKASAASPAATGPRKLKRRADASPAPAPAPVPASLAAITTSTAKDGLDQGPTGPAVSGAANAGAGERRRWPERQGPATAHGEAKRAGPESRGEAGESADPPHRANRLMPTNAVHPTERRTKRRLHKNGAFMAIAAAALLGVLILINQSEPPELVINERQIASRLRTDLDWQSDAGSDSGIFSTAPRRDLEPNVGADMSEGPPAAASATPGEQALAAARTPMPLDPPLTRPNELNVGEIFEMQRILARLDLASDDPNGIVGDETIEAIRMYQAFAGLPIDGEASLTLLVDMREVARILDANN